MQTLNTIFWSSEEYAHDIMPDAKNRQAFGCENDRERLGTGEKGERSINQWHMRFSIIKVPNGKTGLAFQKFHLPGNFPVEQTKMSCSIYKPTRISDNFL